MAKNRTKRFPKKAPGPFRAEPAPKQSVVEVVVGARESLFELSIATGLQVVQALLEEDRTELCGPKGVHDRDRKMYRGGHDDGVLVLGGRKVRVRKPRVRERNGPEVPLETYEALSDEDPLQGRAYEQMILGISTRKYGRSLEPLPEGTKSHATSKSEVSRNFVARTEAQLAAFLGRSLEQWDLPVLMLDGIHFGDHVLLVALGIDKTGRKHVLGIREGTTENEAVCRGLLSDLVDRGLTVERARLFVIDGSKSLKKAIHRVFGAWALIARCRRHKLENVAGHLPKSKATWVRTSMNKAYASSTPEQAARRLNQLASSLEEKHPSAAASIREGLDDTLTVMRLKVAPVLLKSISTTNPIESLNDTLRGVARRVKRWRGGKMVLRWAISGAIEGEKKFRRLRGYREMPGLLSALEALCPAAQQESCGEVKTKHA